MLRKLWTPNGPLRLEVDAFFPCIGHFVPISGFRFSQEWAFEKGEENFFNWVRVTENNCLIMLGLMA